MAVSITGLTGSGSGGNASSYTTASFTISSGGLGIAALLLFGFDSSGLPTINSLSDGASRTWTLRESITGTSGAKTFGLFLYTTPDAGTGTLTWNLSTKANSGFWSVCEASGADTSAPVVQTADNTDGNAASLTVTLSALSDTNNRVFAAFANDSQDDIAPGSGHTEIHDVSGGSPSLTLFSEVGTGGTDNTPNATGTGGLSWIGLAAEIKVAADVTVTATAGSASGTGGTATPTILLAGAAGPASGEGGTALASLSVLAVSGVATAGGGEASISIVVVPPPAEFKDVRGSPFSRPFNTPTRIPAGRRQR